MPGRRRLLVPAAVAIGLLPLAKLVFDAATGGLGQNPIAEALNRLGYWTLLFLALSMWAGATLPGRGSASMLVTGVVVVAYFLNALGAAVDFLETPRKLSPFYWSDGSHVLIHGFDWWRALGLLLVAALFLALAVVNFEHRDISSGRREWSLRGLLRVGRGGGGAEEMAPAGGTGA